MYYIIWLMVPTWASRVIVEVSDDHCGLVYDAQLSLNPVIQVGQGTCTNLTCSISTQSHKSYTQTKCSRVLKTIATCGVSLLGGAAVVVVVAVVVVAVVAVVLVVLVVGSSEGSSVVGVS